MNRFADVKPLVGLDTNVLDYFVRAMTEGYDPESDPDPVLAQEKVAAFRVFLFVDAVVVGPTVSEEIENTRHPGFRQQLTSVRDNLVEELVSLDATEVARQTDFLSRFHSGARNHRDCLVVAEAEVGGLPVLLTFDAVLKKRLDGRTGSLRLTTPSEYWKQLNIPRGQRPRWHPSKTNPLYHATWWHW